MRLVLHKPDRFLGFEVVPEDDFAGGGADVVAETCARNLDRALGAGDVRDSIVIFKPLEEDDLLMITSKLLDEIRDRISSLGIERELITIDDYNRALNEEKYIYVKTYQKIKYTKNKNNDGEKEFYGYLKSFNDEEIEITTMIKAREYTITIPKSLIALIRIAVKF